MREPEEETKHELAIGMEVLSSDGRVVGTVRHMWWPEETRDEPTGLLTEGLPGHPRGKEGVWQPADEGYIEVDRGERGIIDRYLYIPFSAIREVDADHVVLDVQVEEVDRRGWHVRPHFLK